MLEEVVVYIAACVFEGTGLPFQRLYLALAKLPVLLFGSELLPSSFFVSPLDLGGQN